MTSNFLMLNTDKSYLVGPERLRSQLSVALLLDEITAIIYYQAVS